MFERRSFLRSLSSMPVIGALMPAGLAKAATKRDYFKELGVRPFINAAGTYTTLTASLMDPEVVKAIEFASHSFVRLTELHDAVGTRIAELTAAEAAMVSCGAASALTLGTAACMTGSDRKFINQLPDTTGMKTEVIIQKSHRYGYDRAIRNCGAKFVEVETASDFARAVNSQTALALFFNANNNIGQIKDTEFVALGKKHGVPTFNDCAADVPPVENLQKWTKMGFDLVTFSGGKGIRGPQSAGLLVGRKDLIQAARMNASPNGDALGRGMKVNKEELLGMLIAVETYSKKDHKAEMREWEKRCKLISDSIARPGLSTEVRVPEIANAVPHLHIRWDSAKINRSVADVVKALREGDPSIEPNPASKEDLVIGVWMMQPGEAQIVAARIREILKG
ncbi:MAG: aminotransferase class V-fold PLP-dependent enzyme [Acidobacteria bacterium]|nr:aminotransferase class V-fold PLP-dependent enzyme [Acidobacteriota bacterium]